MSGERYTPPEVSEPRPEVTVYVYDPEAYPLGEVEFAKRVNTLSYKVNNGKFEPFEGEVVGHMPPGDGNGKQINGGVAITKHQQLERLNDEYLYNPATDDLFKKTKSGKGYFNKEKGIFVKDWNEQPED